MHLNWIWICRETWPLLNQLTQSMEKRSNWESDICPSSQKFHHFVETYVLLSHWKEQTADLILSYVICVRIWKPYFLNSHFTLFFHPCLGFLSGTIPKDLLQFSSVLCVLHSFIYPKRCWTGHVTKFFAIHCCASSSLFPSICSQILSSSPHSQAPCVWCFPSVWEVNFHNHIKQRAVLYNLHFTVFLYFNLHNFESKREEMLDCEQKFIMRRFMICSPRQILLGCWN